MEMSKLTINLPTSSLTKWRDRMAMGGTRAPRKKNNLLLLLLWFTMRLMLL